VRSQLAAVSLGSRSFATRREDKPVSGSGVAQYTTGKRVTGFSVKDSDVFQNSMAEYRMIRRYQGKVKGVILDWAGTVLDCGVYSPAVVFIEVFQKEGVPITMEEARFPMGAHKKVHIRKITQMSSVRNRWNDKFGKYPDEDDVERMFKNFVPLQVGCLHKYTDMITGAVETVNELKSRGLKIGSTTGFTMEMVDVLKKAASKQGYTPDTYVAADEVPQARPYPYMVWLNCIRLDVNPISAIVKVDDTADGVREGLTAGCWSVGLAKTGNYMGMNEKELADLERNDPDQYARMMRASYETLTNAGAHYVIDTIAGLPRVIDDINRRLAQAESP
jgi:phosphonoacetaldehyde hydrolase